MKQTMFELLFCICIAGECPEKVTDQSPACPVRKWGPYTEEVCESVKADVATFPSIDERVRSSCEKAEEKQTNDAP